MLTALVVLAALGALSAAAFVAHAWYQEHRPDRIPVLLYHRFLSRAAYDRGEVVTEERTYVAFDDDFDAEMQYLRDAGYTPIDLDEFADVLDGRRPFPKKPIVITIDDGFRSVHRFAYPVLKRLGMKAIFFVTPDKTSHNFKEFSDTDEPATDDEIAEMSRNGISIQSHGQTHRHMTDLDDASVLWELTESKKVLEERFGKPVDHLAIPSGAYSRRIRRIVSTSGYRIAFASRKGTNHAGVDRFRMRRLVVGRGFGRDGMANLLEPSTCFQLRLASALQNLVQNFISARGLDRLRGVILSLPFGAALIRRPIRLVIAAAGAAVVALVALAWLLR